VFMNCCTNKFVNFICYEIYNIMEMSPFWETASFAATQEFPNILWNLKFQCHVQKSPPLVPTLNQISLVHATPFDLSKTHFNIIHPPTCSS
jgi:hypothetical protein